MCFAALHEYRIIILEQGGERRLVGLPVLICVCLVEEYLIRGRMRALLVIGDRFYGLKLLFKDIVSLCFFT